MMNLKETFQSRWKNGLPRRNKKLFLEGLRQLRLPGILYAVACLVVTVWRIRFRDYYYDDGYDWWSLFSSFGFDSTIGEETHGFYVDGVNEYLDNLLALGVIFAIVSCFLVTGWLRSHKARDFYCAAPYSLGTLWANFGAAALTWTAAGMLPGLLYAGWELIAGDVRNLGVTLMTLISTLAVALLAHGVTMLAISVTGRLVNALLVAAGMFLIPGTLVKIIEMPYTHVINGSDFYVGVSKGADSPLTYLLRGVLFNDDWGYTSSAGFTYRSPLTLFCCLAVGALLTAAAALIVSARTGEEAGAAFTGKRTHVFGLLCVTVPCTCHAVSLVMRTCMHPDLYGGEVAVSSVVTFSEARWAVSTFVTALLIIVAAMWLAELVFTLNIKRAHHAFRLLPVPVAVACFAMCGAVLCADAAVRRAPSADEVASFSVSISRDTPERLEGFLNSGLFDSVDDDTELYDEELIAFFTDQIRETVKSGYFTKRYRDPEFGSGENDYAEYENGYFPKGSIFVTLHLKKGGSMTRTLLLDRTHLAALEKVLTDNAELVKSCTALPALRDTQMSVSVYGYSESDLREIYRSLSEEYNALTDSEKLALLKRISYNNYSSYYERENHLTDDEFFGKTVKTEPDYDDETTGFTTYYYPEALSSSAGDYVTYRDFGYVADHLEVTFSGYKPGEPHTWEGTGYNVTLPLEEKEFARTYALARQLRRDRLDATLAKAQSSYIYAVSMEYHSPDLTTVNENGVYSYATLNHSYIMLTAENAADVQALLRKKAEELARDAEEDEYDDNDVYVSYKEDANESVRRLLDAVRNTDEVNYDGSWCGVVIIGYADKESMQNGKPSVYGEFYANVPDMLKAVRAADPMTQTE